jgi:hypothetical protein
MAGGSKETRREAAIVALLAEATIEKAAAKAGVSLATLKRWLRDPVFAGAFRAARRELVETAITRLQQTTTSAVSTLYESLHAPQSAVRVRAAAIILEQSLRATELVDLQQQVDELRAALEKLKNEKDPPRPFRSEDRAS